MKLENKHVVPGPVSLMAAGALIALIFLSNLVAIPGPDSLFGLAYEAYFYTFVGTIALPVLLLPFAVLWIFVQATRGVKVFWPVWLALLVQAILLINIILIQDSLQNAARRQIIEEGKAVVGAIESYYEANLQYPDSLSQLYPEFVDEYPSPSIIGIKSFHFARTDSSYSISFYEDFAPFLDYYVVSYSPAGWTDRDEAAWRPIDSSGWWVIDID